MWSGPVASLGAGAGAAAWLMNEGVKTLRSVPARQRFNLPARRAGKSDSDDAAMPQRDGSSNPDRVIVFTAETPPSDRAFLHHLSDLAHRATLPANLPQWRRRAVGRRRFVAQHVASSCSEARRT
jgi:hypothetical protein